MPKESWTDEEINTIQTLWTRGKTAAEIAECLPRKSREAVCAKARRLNLASRAANSFKSSPPRPRPHKKNKKIAALKEPQQKKMKRRKRIAMMEIHEIANTAYGEKIGLSGLNTRTQCCWPVGDPKADDFGFCGAPKIVGNYCEKHSKINLQ